MTSEDQSTVLDVLPFCWMSGLQRKPKDWYGPWWLQCAHIASGQGKARRINDRRAVIGLSPLAHDCHVSNSDAHPTKWINGKEYPTFDERHTLYLKRAIDQKFYSPEFLQTIWIGKVPEPQRPPEFWCKMLFENQGILI